MSETNFFGLSRGRYNPLANSTRPVVVPQRAAGQPVTSVARQTRQEPAVAVVAPKPVAKKPPQPVIVAKPLHRPTHQPVYRQMPVRPVQKPVHHLSPTPAPRPTPAPPAPNPVIPLDDLLSDFIDNKKAVIKTPIKPQKTLVKLSHKLATKGRTKLQSKIKDAKGKVAARLSKKVKKTKKTLPTGVSPTEQPDFAKRALVAAADTTGVVTSNQAPLVMDSGEAVTVAKPENIFDKLNRLPSISFEIKINKRHILTFIRVIIVAAILAVSSYLAWDTWVTNKTVQETFSSPAAALVIDEPGPSGIDTTSVSNQSWSAYTVPADQARYIYLPTINVQARVLSVGINSKGKIDSPKNANDAAWYDGSAKPGQEGQVFIDGHTSFASTYKAVFDDLTKLKIGDTITIERGDGKIINYRVTDSEVVPVEKVDMRKALNVPDGAARGLTLMSCTGKFDYRTQRSDKRVIIYAVQE